MQLDPSEKQPSVSNPDDVPDYLTPVNPPRHPEQNLAIADISSEYITPLAALNPDEEDVPLYQAPVVDDKPSGVSEYEQLNLYEYIEL